MTYYILQDGTTEKKAGSCLVDLIVAAVILIGIGITAGRKSTKRKRGKT